MTNEMLTASPSGNYQVFLQTELEEAGLNVDDVEKVGCVFRRSLRLLVLFRF